MEPEAESSKKLSIAIHPKLQNIDEEMCDDVNIPLQPLQTPTSPGTQYFRSIFDRVDEDHDGYITLPELTRMIRHARLTETPIPPNIIQRIYMMSDTNGDNRISYEEFVNMLKNPQYQKIFGRYMTIYVNFVVPRKKLEGQPYDNELGETLYEDEYSCCPPTLGMILISVIELIFFLIDEFKEENSTNFASGPMAKLFIYDPTKRYEFWRYLTYMFVHIGYLHLIVNLVVQIFVGIPLEMVHGWWRVLLTYFAGVVAGSLGTSLTDPATKLAGASGGVYSLLTAHVATIIMNWREMSFASVQLLIFLLIIGFDVGSSIYNRYTSNVEEHIGYVAHFGGALAGLLVGLVILRNLQFTKKENIIWWFAVAIYVVLMLVAISFNLFYTDYYPKQI